MTDTCGEKRSDQKRRAEQKRRGEQKRREAKRTEEEREEIGIRASDSGWLGGLFGDRIIIVFFWCDENKNVNFGQRSVDHLIGSERALKFILGSSWTLQGELKICYPGTTIGQQPTKITLFVLIK